MIIRLHSLINLAEIIKSVCMKILLSMCKNVISALDIDKGIYHCLVFAFFKPQPKCAAFRVHQHRSIWYNLTKILIRWGSSSVTPNHTLAMYFYHNTNSLNVILKCLQHVNQRINYRPAAWAQVFIFMWDNTISF